MNKAHAIVAAIRSKKPKEHNHEEPVEGCELCHGGEMFAEGGEVIEHEDEMDSWLSDDEDSEKTEPDHKRRIGSIMRGMRMSKMRR